MTDKFSSQQVSIKADDRISLPGELSIPTDAKGLVIFAHGSGSSRRSPRNLQVASVLNVHGFATLLFDLLEPEEADERENVFDIPLLSTRLVAAVNAATAWNSTKGLPIGLFGASTGAAAALVAAAQLGDTISAVVSRGGRPDMAYDSLARVSTPTLLIVGEEDQPVIELNKLALDRLANARMVIVPKATHLFEEPGALETVSRVAATWFERNLPRKKLQAA